jgi:hypothetical protein
MLTCHGGLTPPALGGSAVRRFAGETATCAMHERWFTRAAGVSPPWCAKPTPHRENRAVLSHQRTDYQHHWASARRGTGIAPATPNTSCQTRMLTYHGGLTPPALGGSAVRRFAGETATSPVHKRPFTRAAGSSSPWERNAPAMARVFPGANTFAHHGGLTPPLLAACADVIADTRFAPTSTHLFPRLAYASRSWCTASVDRKITTFAVHKRTFPESGGCQPAVVCKTDPAPRESSAVQQLAKRLPKPAGVSPPWYGNRTGNTEHFLPNEDATMPRGAYAPRSWLHVRMSLQIRASHQRVRCSSHGGLTPPALGCTCGCYCRYAFLTGEHASVSHGWLTSAAPGGWRCNDSQNRRL